MEVLAFLHPGDLGWGFLILFLAFCFLPFVAVVFTIFIWTKLYLKEKERNRQNQKIK